MRTSTLITLFVCLLSVTGSIWGAVAIPTVVIDENGNGTYNGTKLETGFDGTLFYLLPFTTTGGDVVLLEPMSNANSDLLRFQPLAGAAFTRLYVFSELPEAGETPSLADVGVPVPTPNLSIYFDEQGTEDGWNGLVFEATTVSYPGWGGTATVYDFTSDVPEPTTIALLGLGGAALLRRRK
jgi:hypothetical protein